jgi:hypothetical protein
MIASVLIYSFWYGVKTDRYDEILVTYLDTNIPTITSWEYQQIAPLLSKPARLEFETDKGREFYRLLTWLG